MLKIRFTAALLKTVKGVAAVKRCFFINAKTLANSPLKISTLPPLPYIVGVIVDLADNWALSWHSGSSSWGWGGGG